MKTSKTKNAGTSSATPIAVALLAGFTLGAVAYAKRKELGAMGATGAKMLDPVVTGTKSTFDKALDAAKTWFGDKLVYLGKATEQMRAQRAQRLRNPEMLHPQRSGDSDRLHAVG